MQRKLIFFDIDGTILDWHGVIPKSARSAILQLKAKGHLPLLCTGRSRGNIRDPQLFALGFAGLIAACGSHVEVDGRRIYERFLTEAQVKKVIAVAEACRVPIVLEGAKKHWFSIKGFERDGFVARMCEEMGEDAVPLRGFSADMQVNKFAGDFIVASDAERFHAELKDDVDFIEHGLAPDLIHAQGDEPNSVRAVFEAVLPGMSKAQGIRVLCDYLGADPKDAIAVGDSTNDIEMLQSVGYGIAMGNGSDSIKAVADYITDDIHADGLLHAMEHLSLL